MLCVHPHRLEPLFSALLETGYPFLKELYLWNMTLRNEDTAVLSHYFKTRRDFTKFEMLACKFADDRSIATLAEGLGFNKLISTINFSFVPIGTEGLRVLALGPSILPAARGVRVCLCVCVSVCLCLCVCVCVSVCLRANSE